MDWDRADLARFTGPVDRPPWYPNPLRGEPDDDSLFEEEEVWPNSPPRSSRIALDEPTLAAHQLDSNHFPFFFNLDSGLFKNGTGGGAERRSEEKNRNIERRRSESESGERLNSSNEEEVVVMEVASNTNSIPPMISFRLVCPSPKAAPWFVRGSKNLKKPDCVYVQV
jgi:hypothetical protein